ncbi:acetyl-CoA carboxylase [Lentilactobacillus sp. Marseille-Q4993]|uniref:acetyl-CoA carboxylase n=1 Tax=Lentilactobacillus sp. Marseille-Q4993 TaxID=3039492 RepID=UPI0024BCFDD0|nr:acetyl-CoA carboxylase [Lentilactobacillus sp. Marseille-Q4993]
MNRDVKILLERIQPLFKRMSQTRYWIRVVNDQFDEQYNFFFHSQHRGMREKSVPLHSIKNYRLEYLEKVISLFKENLNLSIYYAGFKGLRWPSTNKRIQWK